LSTERFLVTGALGCIGAWTVRNLVREGVPVVVFDLGTDTRRLQWLMTPEELARVQLVQGDITDLARLEQALDQYAISHIIHLAALLLPACKANPILGAQVNVLGGLNVFEAARRNGQIQRIVYASSIAVYEADVVAPGEVVTHEAMGRPTNLYGVYKQAIEGAARCYALDHNVSSIGLRPGTVFGVGRDNGITAAPTQAMLAAALGQPYHIPYGGRGEFQYADDVARTFIACARAGFSDAEVFNLHGSVAHMSEVVAAIEAAAPAARGAITFSEPGFPSPEAFDDSALRAVIGALPYTPLLEAVAETVAIFRQQVNNRVITHL
jgi:nucleoside-diphosphate-sugar epimerase